MGLDRILHRDPSPSWPSISSSTTIRRHLSAIGSAVIIPDADVTLRKRHERAIGTTAGRAAD